MFTKLGLSPEYHRESIVTERYEAINIYRSAKGAMNNYDMEKCHHLLQRLEELVNTDILANRQELKSMDSICRLNKGEITADECMIGLQEALLQNVESVTLIGVEGTGDGELPKRGVEGGAIAEPCAHENNNSGQAWISIHVSPLSESTCKLLNRLGTERYARWCGRGTNHPPIRLKNHMSSFYQGWRRETRDRVVKKEPKKS